MNGPNNTIIFLSFDNNDSRTGRSVKTSYSVKTGGFYPRPGEIDKTPLIMICNDSQVVY